MANGDLEAFVCVSWYAGVPQAQQNAMRDYWLCGSMQWNHLLFYFM